jgi:hypothetical protein
MAKGKALPPFPRICCALSLSLSLFRCFCSLSFYDLSDDTKHTREENVVFRGKKEE